MRRMIPYSVDITGNFVYPPQLIEARKQVQEELLNVAQLLEIENKEIQHIVDTCKQIGLKCVTDGDYRSNGYTDFFHHLQNNGKFLHHFCKSLHTISYSFHPLSLFLFVIFGNYSGV